MGLDPISLLNTGAIAFLVCALVAGYLRGRKGESGECQGAPGGLRGVPGEPEEFQDASGGRQDVPDELKNAPTTNTLVRAMLPLAGIAAVCALALLHHAGLLVGNPAVYALALAFICAFSTGHMGKGWIRAKTGGWPKRRVLAVALAFYVLLSYIALELPSNPLLWEITTHKRGLVAELLIVALVILALWYLSQRRRPAAAVALTAFFALGTIEYFVCLFRQVPILPYDVLAISTAISVGARYQYVFDARVVLALCCVVVGWAYVSLVPACETRRRHGVLANVGQSLLCVALIVLGVTQVDFVGTAKIATGSWRPTEAYMQNYFLPSFVARAQAMTPREPDGYTASAADGLLLSYADAYDAQEGSSPERRAAQRQFAEEAPSIVAIMNESFADLSLFGQLGGQYAGPEFIRATDNFLFKGNLDVSVYGGGTCNSEFEFLTGLSLGFFNAGAPLHALRPGWPGCLAGAACGIGLRHLGPPSEHAHQLGARRGLPRSRLRTLPFARRLRRGADAARVHHRRGNVWPHFGHPAGRRRAAVRVRRDHAKPRGIRQGAAGRHVDPLRRGRSGSLRRKPERAGG